MTGAERATLSLGYETQRTIIFINPFIFINPWKPHQDRFVNSLNGMFQPRCLNLHLFYNLTHAQAVFEAFRSEYNRNKLHESLNGTPCGV